MTNKYIQYFLVLSLAVLYVEIRIDGFDKDRIEIKSDIINNKERLKRHTDSAIQNVQNLLTEKTDLVQKKAFIKYKNELIALNDSISNEKLRLANIKNESERLSKGLPDLIDLEKLNDYYVKKFGKDKYSWETFETSKGQISFSLNNFSFNYLQNPYGLAYLRIGKVDESRDDKDLINAWLSESASSKIEQGYHHIYNKNGITDYGEYTEKTYQKGDMYFKTYFKYERVQGTYNSTSFQYTFYVETGSKSKKNKLRISEYNQKLGS